MKEELSEQIEAKILANTFAAQELCIPKSFLPRDSYCVGLHLCFFEVSEKGKQMYPDGKTESQPKQRRPTEEQGIQHLNCVNEVEL